MIEPVQVPAILDKLTTLKDGSLKLTFETQELQAASAANLMGMCNKLGWLVYAPNKQDQIFVPDEPPKEFKNEKSHSQRLRAVQFVLWKQLGGKGEFESYYRANMEKVISWFREKLD